MKLLGALLAVSFFVVLAQPKPAEAGIGTCWGNLVSGMIRAGWDMNDASAIAMDICVYNRRLGV